MQPDVLMIEPLTPEAERQLDNAYRVHRLFQTGDPAKLVAEIGPSIRAVVTGGGHGVSNAIADALPALEIIAINGIGTDAVDLERAQARGVRVTTTPGVLTEDVGRPGHRADAGGVAADLRRRSLCPGRKLAVGASAAVRQGKRQAAGDFRARPCRPRGRAPRRRVWDADRLL